MAKDHCLLDLDGEPWTTERLYTVGATAYIFLNSLTKLLLFVMPTRLIISLTLRKLVLRSTSARRILSCLRYWVGVFPVSVLNRCRKREAERLTSRASSLISIRSETRRSSRATMT